MSEPQSKIFQTSRLKYIIKCIYFEFCECHCDWIKKKIILIDICFVVKTFYVLAQCWLNWVKKFLMYICVFIGKLNECSVAWKEPDSSSKGYNVPEIESHYIDNDLLALLLSHPACGVLWLLSNSGGLVEFFCSALIMYQFQKWM